MTVTINIDRDVAVETQRERAAGAPRVLVFGDDTRSFLATVRSLGRRGIEVHVAPNDMQSPALRSRYIARVHRLPPYVGDGGEWLRAVSALLAAERFALVIPCQDTSLLPFHAHRDLFEPLARLAIPEPAAVDILFDKEKTKTLAAQLGVNVAHSVDPEAYADPEEAFRRLGAPIVVKPKNSFRLGDLYRRGVVQIVDTPQELTRATADLDPRAYYLEEFFQGRGVGLSVLADRGEIVLAFQHHRVHEGSRGGAAPYRVSAAIAPELLDACRKITDHVALTGVAMFEFRRNFDTGRWILLEINARPWGSLPLPIALGVDFPFSWYRLLVEGERPERRDYRVGVYGRNLGLDIPFLLGELSEANGLLGRAGVAARWLAGFSHLIAGAERDDTIVADDPRPGLIEIRGLLSSYARRAAKRLPFFHSVQHAVTHRRLQAALRNALERSGRVKLVFVCFGNICRSPFAEALATKLFARFGDRVSVVSAGTYPVAGRGSPPEALTAAEGFGIDLSSHRSRAISDAMLDDGSVICVFDTRNEAAVMTQFADLRRPVISLGHLAAKAEGGEIADPFGHGLGAFERSYRLIENALQTISEALEQLTKTPAVLRRMPAGMPRQPAADGAPIAFAISRVDAIPNLAAMWRDLQERAEASFFLTWDWIGCWLEQTRLPAFVVSGEQNGRVILLGLVHPQSYRRHAVINSEALLLNQAGDSELDCVTIEYNGFLVDRRFREPAIRGCLRFLQTAQATDTIGHRWDEIHLDGVPDMFESLAEDTGLTPWLRARKPSWQVNLAAVRRSGLPFLEHLSANTRYQIRRSVRLYEKRGALTAQRAADMEEAMRFYGEMQELHQRYWIGRGQRGAHAFPFYGRFHRALLKRCLAAGTVELVRIAAGDSVIGYVYNLIHDGWACAYQTGLAYDDDPKLKPGLVAHYLCIERHLAEGARCYDFLAGDSRYKRSFGTPGPDMVELVLQRPVAKLRIESALREVKRTFTGVPLQS